MSWCGGGEIRPTPGVECRVLAIHGYTLWPGSWPPSPGLLPCAILICRSVALTRYSLVTPKRPEATCLMALRRQSPLGSGMKRAGSSPPSPVFDLAPSLFMAMASVSWASWLMEPYDMAPVAKRLRIASTGSTSSIGIGCLAHLSSNSPRRVHRFWLVLLTSVVYSLKMVYWPVRVEYCSFATVSGFRR